MKKLITLIMLAFIIYFGYNFINSPTGQDTVETAKITKLSYEVVNEKDPAKVLKLVEANEELVLKMIDEEVITEDIFNQFKGLMNDLDANGQEVDKKALAEIYIKDRVSSSVFSEIVNTLDKDKLDLSDIVKIENLLNN